MRCECVECGRMWGAFWLRVGLGQLYFIAGLNKFMGGLPQFRTQMLSMFEPTWLPPVLLMPYVYVLPFAELIIGTLVILGLLRDWAVGAGLALMVSLAFGMLVLGKNSDVVFYNTVYVALYTAAMFISPWDKIKVDWLFSRKRAGA